ncbi:reverse transcriptase [Tanacetum coccineum]
MCAHYVNPVGRSGGLDLWWVSTVVLDIITSNKNLINAQASAQTQPTDMAHLFMCFVYAPHDRALRAPVWEAITQRSSSVGPCLVIGDFNLIGELSDKVGGLLNLHHIEEFQNFTADAGLIDIKVYMVQPTN